jgi:hypothetical protein
MSIPRQSAGAVLVVLGSAIVVIAVVAAGYLIMAAG